MIDTPTDTARTTAPKTPLSGLLSGRRRRELPATFVAPRSVAKAPDGLEMSRELSEVSREAEEAFRELQADMLSRQVELARTFQARVDGIIVTAARRERVAEASELRLREAIEGARNDERSRVLQAECERKDGVIAELQRECDRLRTLGRGTVGWDRRTYFARLGEFLQEISNDLQESSDHLGELARSGRFEPGLLRALSEKMRNIGLDTEEFGQNATLYADDAPANAAD